MKEPPRYRPSLDRFTASFIKKNYVSGLHDSEIEHGEIALTVQSNIKCEHNLQDLEYDVVGTLLLTNYKLLLKPIAIARGDEILNNSKEMKILGRARVQAYFVITLGHLFSVEVRPVTEGNKVKHSCIDIVTKDCRKLSFLIKDYKKSV